MLFIFYATSSSEDKHGLFVLSVSDLLLSNLPSLAYRTAPFPSFCSSSFSLWFTAGPQGRGTCLRSLSPEGAGRKLAITKSKYVHAKSTVLWGTEHCLLAQRWRIGGSPINTCPVFHLFYITYTKCQSSVWLHDALQKQLTGCTNNYSKGEMQIFTTTHKPSATFYI